MLDLAKEKTKAKHRFNPIQQAEFTVRVNSVIKTLILIKIKNKYFLKTFNEIVFKHWHFPFKKKKYFNFFFLEKLLAKHRAAWRREAERKGEINQEISPGTQCSTGWKY